MKKLSIMAVIMAFGAQISFASPQNIATISDLKETIQILLKHKKQAEDRLLVLERKLGITNEYQNNTNGIGDDIAIDSRVAIGGGSQAQVEIDTLKSQIVEIQALLKRIDPNFELTQSDDLLSKTYVTQKEFEEFKNFVMGEMGEIKKTNERINQILNDNGHLGGANTTTAEMWERIKRIEQGLKNCNCALPESEIK